MTHEITQQSEFATWFRTLAPYVRQHRDHCFVISLPTHFFQLPQPKISAFTYDLAILHSLGIRLVVTFSAEPYIADFLLQSDKTDQPLKKHASVPITLNMLKALTHQAAEHIQTLQALLSMNLPHSPMQGAQLEVCTGNWVIAKPYGIHQGIDYLALGQVRKIQVDQIQHHLHHQTLILVPPVASAPTGENFGLASGDLAAALASQLTANKLIFLANTAPLPTKQGTLCRELEASALRLADFTAEHQGLVSTAQKTVQQGVHRVHIIASHQDGSLLQELFSREGSGTLITNEAFESIRAAQLEDIAEIMRLMHPLENSGVIVKRSKHLLTQDIQSFYVIERDHSVIGCAALYPYPNEKMAELAAIVISPLYRDAKRGEKLLSYLVKQAKHQGIQELFVLTTQSQHWFLQQGFTLKDPKVLPKEKQAAYNPKRNSQVLIKYLQSLD